MSTAPNSPRGVTDAGHCGRQVDVGPSTQQRRGGQHHGQQSQHDQHHGHLGPGDEHLVAKWVRDEEVAVAGDSSLIQGGGGQ